MPWNNTYTTIIAVPCTIIFLAIWYEQFRSNIIFANLRKDKKSGKVVTEEHRIPHGRMFEYVSSPHRMCEIILYTILLLLIPTRTFFCIYLWVLGNQVCSIYIFFNYLDLGFTAASAAYVSLITVERSLCPSSKNKVSPSQILFNSVQRSSCESRTDIQSYFRSKTL